jgi:hypothetical protein
VSVAGNSYLAHTLDISASGARIVLAKSLAPETEITLEFKRRRTMGTVVWCKRLGQSKYDHEIGLHLPRAGSNFWGITLPHSELETAEQAPAIPFERFMEFLSKQA